jgi:hypothetical protein
LPLKMSGKIFWGKSFEKSISQEILRKILWKVIFREKNVWKIGPRSKSPVEFLSPS